MTHTQRRYYDIDEETLVQKAGVTFPRLCQSVSGRGFKPTQSFSHKRGGRERRGGEGKEEKGVEYLFAIGSLTASSYPPTGAWPLIGFMPMWSMHLASFLAVGFSF